MLSKGFGQASSRVVRHDDCGFSFWPVEHMPCLLPPPAGAGGAIDPHSPGLRLGLAILRPLRGLEVWQSIIVEIYDALH